MEGDEEARADYRRRTADGDMGVIPVWASEAIDLITSTRPAAELVAELVVATEEVVSRLVRAVE